MFCIRRSSTTIALLLALFTPAMLPSAAKGNDSVPRADSGDDVLSAHIMSIFDTVIEHHVDPPTRQSLVLSFCRSISPENPKPIGLGKAISSATRDEMRSIIEEQIATQSGEGRLTAIAEALRSTLERLAATRIVERSEQRVNEQLAANRYVGIGIALGMKDGLPAMMKVIEDGPADRGGARDGDLIVRVDGQDTKGKNLREVIDMLRGVRGSDVDVILRQSGKQERELNLVRDVVPFKHVVNFRMVRPEIAAVTIESISGSIVRDLRKLTPRLREENVKGIVLEVRNGNPAHRPALTFANALIDGKRIGAIETSTGIEEVVADSGALWPGVAVAITYPLPAQDSLAWALDALSNQDRIFVERFSMQKNTTMVPHAWRYETVDIENDDDQVLIMPTGRLLGIDESGDGYRQLDGGVAFSDPVNRAESSMVRQSFAVGQGRPNQNLLTRAIAVLQKMITDASSSN